MTIEQVGEVLKGNVVGARCSGSMTDVPQLQSTSKTATSSILPSRSTYSPSYRSSMNWYVGLFAVAHDYADTWLNRLVLRAIR